MGPDKLDAWAPSGSWGFPRLPRLHGWLLGLLTGPPSLYRGDLIQLPACHYVLSALVHSNALSHSLVL